MSCWLASALLLRLPASPASGTLSETELASPPPPPPLLLSESLLLLSTPSLLPFPPTQRPC
eukprot:3141116-Rhodomonas_salina.1